jgi:DNA-binding MarR family transcriptional regulator
MAIKPVNLVSAQMAGWTPSAEAQQIILWRILQMFLARYGSVPLGQLLVSMTTVVLNELGRAPTVTELCEATGLPKSSISRYISAQMELDLLTETIDPRDRRRRLLSLTETGQAERRWQLARMRRILEAACDWDRGREAAGQLDPDDELEAMKAVARGEASEPFHPRRKGSQSDAA